MLIEEVLYNCNASTQLAVSAGEDATHYCVSSIYRHRGELALRLEAQNTAFEEMQKKNQEELEEKKQHDADNLIGFLLRARATQQESIILSIVMSNLSWCYFLLSFLFRG
ncbi:hypothetical protein VPH35_005694 [Triticum aestivum]